MNRLLAGALLLFMPASPALAQDKLVTITLHIDKDIKAPTPVCLPVSVPKELASWDMFYAPTGPKDVHFPQDQDNIWGQLTAPGLLTDAVKPAGPTLVRRDLHFILKDKIAAGTKLTLSFKQLRLKDIGLPDFVWTTAGKPLQHQDLCFGTRPVLRYVCQAYDERTPELRNRTYKVFHHLWDPTGKHLVTNGGHLDDPKVEMKTFPHHRGIQMGFSKTMYAGGKKRADTWHCQKDDHQSHEKFLHVEGRFILGRHRVAIDWHGEKKEVIVKEERELTVYDVRGGTLVEFVSRLRPAGGDVILDGDPQHAGFQFRAHNDVFKKTAKQTYYVRPDGKGKPGETRNWDPKTKKGPVDLPWNAMCFVLDGKRYTVCYLDHPKNPRDSRHSERDYGRFGCYFEHKLTAEQPLTLRYRLWLQEGEMTGDQVQGLSDGFVTPPAAKLSS